MTPVSQIALVLASQPAPAHKTRVHGAALADTLLAVAWVLLIGDLLRQAGRVHVSAGRRLVGVLLLGVMLVAGCTLEVSTGGRFAWSPLPAVLGVAAAWLGLGLHTWARRTLARGWSPVVSPPTDASLVEAGPYAHLRHPLYTAILLVAFGTLAAHLSRATLAATAGFVVGIALKARAEDHALERRFGERWRAYAARVPAFVPRLRRARP